MSTPKCFGPQGIIIRESTFVKYVSCRVGAVYQDSISLMYTAILKKKTVCFELRDFYTPCIRCYLCVNNS